MNVYCFSEKPGAPSLETYYKYEWAKNHLVDARYNWGRNTASLEYKYPLKMQMSGKCTIKYAEKQGFTASLSFDL